MTYDDRPEPAKRLQAAREARGFATPKEAAIYFGWVYETYIQHEQGIRGITRAAAKYAQAFRVSEGWLLTGEGIGPDDNKPKTVPITGMAGAGPDGTVLFATGDSNFGEITAPVNSTPTTEALEVKGDSMRGIANDGWIITYDEKQPPNEDHMGEPCVCWLEDDRVLVKIPFPGRGPGLFDLESANAPTMRDVPVRYFALITNIVPRRAARKFIKRNPDHGIKDVKIA
ncbi:hypothetical protein [Mesorhizobium sp. RMAD-H1]|uniref:hypothetical protein n=1 Tax=Mesorhizobium sp. RMAD-H1 TaxID=2587065 RepID=UPI001819406A|nr:hypothetical protein [Mesorhizobium sp. RMAD-H1]MBB2973978.1 hypothetical protein [Mesorhizobium sp. RMAD-H1]